MQGLKNKVLNKFDAKGEIIEHDFEQLKELETCTLNQFEVNDEIIKKLNEIKTLKMLIFNHCVFKNEEKLEGDIENLIITYSKKIKFENIKNPKKIKYLMLNKIESIDINELKIFENLEEISIFECEIKNFSEINNFKNLKELKLDGSQIDNKEKLQELQNRINIQYNETYHVGF